MSANHNDKRFRRHQQIRAKRRELRKWRAHSDTHLDERGLGIRANTRCLCSCHMCKAGRRSSEWASAIQRLTMQERRHIADIAEGINEAIEE